MHSAKCVLFSLLILGAAREIHQKNIKQTGRLVLRQIMPNLPDSVKRDIADKRQAALEDGKYNNDIADEPLNAKTLEYRYEGKALYNLLIEKIMSKASDYYNEFKKFSDDLNQEEDEAARFEKFKEHLADSAREFAPYIASSYTNIDPNRETMEEMYESKPKPNKLKDPKKNKGKGSKLLKKRVYTPLKDKEFDNFYDYNNF